MISRGGHLLRPRRTPHKPATQRLYTALLQTYNDRYTPGRITGQEGNETIEPALEASAT